MYRKGEVGAGGEEEGGKGRKKKDACIQIRGLAELMGTKHGAFFSEGEGKKKKNVICIMGKRLESTLRAPLLWGQSVTEEEKLLSDEGPIPRFCEREMHAGDMPLRSLPPARFICETIYQQSRPRASLPPHSAEKTPGAEIAATSSR